MANIETMKINLAKNEAKLANKITLLGKYEAKKAKLSAQWKKLTGVEYVNTIEDMKTKPDDLGMYGKLSKYYSKEVADMYFDVSPYYEETSSNPIISTQMGIEELEARCQKYRDSIAKEEKTVADRNANIEANSVSVNGKTVNVIMEFLDNWEKEVTTYYMQIFELFAKEHKSYYAENIENSIEYIIMYHKVYEYRNVINDMWVNSAYTEFYPTYIEYEKATDKHECYKAIVNALNKSIERYESMFSIKIIEKWGKSKWHPNEEMFEMNMRKDVAKEKNRKYDQLIKDVENICGKIIDMSNIKIGAKGDIEGYVVGTEGEAELWTTGAGGFNTNVIVNVNHGQRFHFRFYCRKRA